jgi:hypothetical protein
MDTATPPRRPGSRIGPVILGLALLAICGCCSIPIYFRLVPFNISGNEYEQARARWQAQGITEYEVTLQRVCFCPFSDFQLHVVDGKIDPTRSTIQGQPITESADDIEKDYGTLTVEGQFRGVRQLLGRGLTLDSEVYTTITFDPVLGYVSRVNDTPQPGVETTDLFYTYEVTQLKIIKTTAPTP